MSSAFSALTVPKRAATRNTSAGFVDVDVHAHLVVQAGHDQAAAERGQLLAQVATVDALGDDHALGAEAVRELLRLTGADLREFRLRECRHDHHRVVLRAARDVLGHAFHQLDETLRTGIDDVGLAQHLELEFRALEGSARRRDAAVQQRGQVAHALAPHGLYLMREVGEHREDGALARLAQALARVVGTAAHAVHELVRADAPEVTELVAEAEEELREDRAGVAARAVERGVGDACQGLAGVIVGCALQAAEHGAHGEREVGAGVAVGHREYVDLVQVLLLREQACDAGLQRTVEAQAVEVLGNDRGGVHALAPRLSPGTAGTGCRPRS